jgi:rSAM/selenodomain-associated transferase 2
MTNRISIIIPVLNEEAKIGKLLEHLLANSSSKNVSEIIVVDGGSSDQTVNIVNAFSNVENSRSKKAFHFIDTRIIKKEASALENFKTNILSLNSKKGRAKQMNWGAKHAEANILYFLHADSFPPNSFDDLIINEIQKGNEAGCFRMQFKSNHWWLKLASWFTQFNWRPCRGGDQSQFISKSLFNSIGGYDESYLIYEDNILINKLYARNQYVVINEKIKTSARLYKKHGVFKLQWIYFNIYIKKWLGTSAEELCSYYKSKIY